MIELGDRVKEMVTGLEGIAAMRVEFMYGCNRIRICPQVVKDGKPVDEYVFDEQQIEVLGKGEVNLKPYKTEWPIKGGSKVKDLITGFTGVVDACCFCAHDYVELRVQGTVLHEGKPVDPVWFPSERLILMEQKKPPMSKDISGNPPGGQKDHEPKSRRTL